MKGLIILLFITIWCCTVLGKSDIGKRGHNVQPRLTKNLSKENGIVETDVHEAKTKARAVNKAKNSKHKSNVGSKIWGKRHQPDDHNHKEYLLALNGLETRRHMASSSSASLSGSSSRELADWKEAWEDMWMKSQAQMKNFTDPGGDKFNMAAGRPWGVPCGDLAQHDMPWGSCVLPAECEGGLRIYRGDHFCGRTQFICCSLAFTTYDNYQAFDLSLADTSLQPDSAELRHKKKHPGYKSRLNRQRDERRELREQRKKRIRVLCRKILKQVHRALDRSYKNASRERKKKTKIMKHFVAYLKRRFKRDRLMAQEIHEYNLYTVDNALYMKLLELKELNGDLMTNDTFRQILMTKLMDIKSARMLVDTYPQLKDLVERGLTRRVEGAATPIPATVPSQPSTLVARRSGSLARRSGYVARRSGSVVPRRPRRRKYLDYDVEYGLLYS